MSVVVETVYGSASEKAWVPKVDSWWSRWRSGMADIAITDVDSAETKIRVVFLKGELSGTPIY